MDLKNRVTLESDPVWPDRFEEERRQIVEVSGDQLLGVFHVGSTAISGVPGKPTLDVIAVYEDEESMDTAAEALTNNGAYEREPESTVIIRWGEDHGVFIKMHTQDDEKVHNQLVFRDYLRENPDARQQYTDVKRKAAEKHSDDLEAYTKAKSEVVSSILERARAEGYYDRLPKCI